MMHIRLFTPSFCYFRFFLLFSLMTFLQASPLLAMDLVANDVKRVMATQEWIEVVAKENVTFGDKKWTGTQDLSFNYRLGDRKGVLYLWVQVTDDIVTQSQSSIDDDHVEIWLADPLLVAQYRKHIAAVNESVQEFENRLNRPGSTKYEKEFLTQQHGTLKRIKADPYFRQIIFYSGESEEDFSDGFDRESYMYTYNRTKFGYEMFAVIPLWQAIDFANSPVNNLSLLVDVVDVDDVKSKVNRQESLMSSSKDRRYNDPTSFQLLSA